MNPQVIPLAAGAASIALIVSLLASPTTAKPIKNNNKRQSPEIATPPKINNSVFWVVNDAEPQPRPKPGNTGGNSFVNTNIVQGRLGRLRKAVILNTDLERDQLYTST